MSESNNFKLLLTIDFEEQRRLEKAGFPNEAIAESLKGTYRILELFEKLELLARILRKNDKPFGGIQLGLSGDFLQLPCINSTKFCFESPIWNKVLKKIVYFHKIHRLHLH